MHTLRLQSALIAIPRAPSERRPLPQPTRHTYPRSLRRQPRRTPNLRHPHQINGRSPRQVTQPGTVLAQIQDAARVVELPVGGEWAEGGGVAKMRRRGAGLDLDPRRTHSGESCHVAAGHRPADTTPQAKHARAHKVQFNNFLLRAG